MVNRQQQQDEQGSPDGLPGAPALSNLPSRNTDTPNYTDVFSFRQVTRDPPLIERTRFPQVPALSIWHTRGAIHRILTGGTAARRRSHPVPTSLEFGSLGRQPLGRRRLARDGDIEQLEPQRAHSDKSLEIGFSSSAVNGVGQRLEVAVVGCQRVTARGGAATSGRGGSRVRATRAAPIRARATLSLTAARRSPCGDAAAGEMRTRARASNWRLPDVAADRLPPRPDVGPSARQFTRWAANDRDFEPLADANSLAGGT